MNLQHSINPTAFSHSNNYIWFFRNPTYLWQKYVKLVTDVMNSAILHKCRSINFSEGIISRKNYATLTVQIHNFIMENQTRNLKFIMFHADNINSVKMYKRTFSKVELDRIFFYIIMTYNLQRKIKLTITRYIENICIWEKK